MSEKSDMTDGSSHDRSRLRPTLRALRKSVALTEDGASPVARRAGTVPFGDSPHAAPAWKAGADHAPQPAAAGQARLRLLRSAIGAHGRVRCPDIVHGDV